jgi:hypothetical protein
MHNRRPPCSHPMSCSMHADFLEEMPTNSNGSLTKERPSWLPSHVQFLGEAGGWKFKNLIPPERWHELELQAMMQPQEHTPVPPTAPEASAASQTSAPTMSQEVQTKLAQASTALNVLGLCRSWMSKYKQGQRGKCSGSKRSGPLMRLCALFVAKQMMILRCSYSVMGQKREGSGTQAFMIHSNVGGIMVASQMRSLQGSPRLMFSLPLMTNHGVVTSVQITTTALANS